MKSTTLRDQVTDILLSADGWVPRLRLIQLTGFDKGYAALLGPANGPGKPTSLKALGYVEVKDEDNRVSYRLTPEGRRFFNADEAPPNNWQKAVLGVQALGGRASRATIRRWILEHFPDYNDINLRMDLDMLCVNSPTRRAYLKSPKPDDPRNALVRREGQGEHTIYSLYDPEEHGVWVTSTSDESTLIHLTAPTETGVLRLQKAALPEFDPRNVEDARNFVDRSVAVRRGQLAFRQSLLDLYERRCSVSGCRIPEILEAAHIVPYLGDETHHLTNGLLLRADLHTLFDLGLLRVDPTTLRVEIHPSVIEEPIYNEIHGCTLRSATPRPSAKALLHHREKHLAVWAST
ncbi:MAG: HNH endonuclease signature motif containing protein [Pseudomonadota bacterium]